MNFKSILSTRIGMSEVEEMLRQTHNSDAKKQELYGILIDEDETLGYHAGWILTHFTDNDNKWLFSKQNELIDNLLICSHGGRRRIILQLLYKQPLHNPPRVDLLDYCLDRIISAELPAVKTLCIKIAYEICLPIPELKQELKTILEMMDGDLEPAILNIRRRVLTAMQKSVSLQKVKV